MKFSSYKSCNENMVKFESEEIHLSLECTKDFTISIF